MNKKGSARWERRERKHRKRRYGMRVSGRSIKAVLLRLMGKKAPQAESDETETKEGEKG
jgi:hypothetical protein